MAEIQGIVPPRIAQGYIEDGLVLGESGGFGLTPDLSIVPPIPVDHPIVADMQEPFTLSGFERPRVPILIGSVDLSGVPEGADVHNVPIKFPGTEYRVPSELGYLASILTMCASVEEAVNERYKDYYAYLSVERTYVPAGLTQRTSFIHSDGLQGARVQPKVPTEHMYQACSDYPPRFFTHPFDMTGLDVDVHDLDAVFTRQAREKDSVVFGPNDLVLFDTYNLHQARQASVSGLRTFLRLSYAAPERQFDREGNTRNTLFEEEYRSEGWEFQKRGKVELISPPNIKPAE